MEHQARKRFGQHFLHDPGVIQRIINAIHPCAGDTLVEIGPGLGAISRGLLERLGSLHVVELDRDVIPLLQRACAGLGDLKIHQQDALSFDLNDAIGPRPLRVVGNLPYNISTPLLFHLLEQIEQIADMHFLLQKEVVDRLTATPGGHAYGRLSVMIQYHCQATRLFDVAPGAFSPPPKVNSAVVRLIPHSKPVQAANDPEHLGRLVRDAFSQRRKTLRNAISLYCSPTMIEAVGIDPQQRPETLSVDDFVRLSNACLDRQGSKPI